MKYFFLTIIFIISSFQSLYSQKKYSDKLKEWFFPTQKEVHSAHPKLDTSEALLSDSAETFFSKHYSPDIDESGLEISGEESEYDEEIEAEELFYLDSLESIGVTHHVILKNEKEWLSVDTLYKYFDSLRVNPYRFDPSKIVDSIRLVLYEDSRSWSMPLDSIHYITSRFGPRGSSNHYGIDIGLDIGDKVHATFDGVVRISKYNPGGYGNYILLRHYNGTETIYGHLSQRLVVVGQEVKAGEIIGLGGNTGRSSGPHLHLEVRYKGIALDPALFFNFSKRELTDRTVVVSTKRFSAVKTVRNKVYHKVRRGDTLYGIARKYNIKASSICKINRISTRTTLKVGQTIRVK